MADAEGKKLTELRVIDLKTELERRGLDKTGNKAALLERLAKAITDEGGDPEECLIVPSGPTPVKASPKKPVGQAPVAAEESSDAEMQQKDISMSENSEPNTEIEPEPESVGDNKEKQDCGNEVNEEPKKSEEESKLETNNAEDPLSAVEANGIDNEDSINLTIGEDEENLLAEETETPDTHKDGGAKKRIEESKKGDSKGSGRAESGGSNKDGTSSASGAISSLKNKDSDKDGGKSGDFLKGSKRDDKDKKTTQGSTVNASSRNLWVSGLSSTTRATDLKQIFSKYGKVIGAKVVTNARTPGARCYGYVTMSTSEDAAKCIQHLHRTELHGRVISVEKAKGDSQQSHARKRESNGKSEKKEEEKAKERSEITEEPKEKEKMEEAESRQKSAEPDKEEEVTEAVIIVDTPRDLSEEKKEGSPKDSDSRSTKSTSKKPESERGKRDEKSKRSWDRSRDDKRSRSKSQNRDRRRDVLSFAKIKEERERQRMRDRDRILREEDRRRREDMERQREVERRHREEAARLEREREKLRRERERIELEKAELLRLEREHQKMEREKLERERLELKRQQMRLEENRRPPPPPTIKRTSTDRRDPRDFLGEPERKRLATDRRHSPERPADTERRSSILDRVGERRIETSSSSRYDSGRSSQELAIKKDFKSRTEFSSRSSRPEPFSDVSRGREVLVRREGGIGSQSSPVDPRQVKDSRYDRPAATSYNRERDVRRSEPESHRSSSRDSRYNDNSSKQPGSTTPRQQNFGPYTGDSRYVDGNRQASGWHSGPPSSKSFNSVPSGGSRDPRNEPSGWSSSRSSDNVNRWSNSNSSMGGNMRHPGPPMYQSGPMQSMGMSAPGTAGSYDRFDPYKSSMQNMRKY